MRSNTRNLPYIRNFAEAESFFNNTRKPPRSARWQGYQRPLKNSSAVHYRIERLWGGEAYDLVLYYTVMARFYKPDADGFERRLFRGTPTNTSHAFMANVMGVGTWYSCFDLNNNRVAAPVYDKTSIHDSGDAFSALFYFNAAGKLDTSRSSHTMHYRLVSSAHDKAERKEIKAKLANYVMLAVMRMPEYIENVTLDVDLGKPFGGDPREFEKSWAVQDILRGDLTRGGLDCFFEMIAQGTFDVLASKRAYAQPGFAMTDYWSRSAGHPCDGYDKLERPITPKEFEQALFKRCLKLAHASRPTQPQELPQFMRKEDYPRTNIHV